MTGHRARLRASPFALAVAGLFMGAALATVAILFDHHRVLAQSGLSADYRTGAAWDGAPEFTTIDNGISAELVRRRSRERNGSAFTVTWRGYVIAPRRDQ